MDGTISLESLECHLSFFYELQAMQSMDQLAFPSLVPSHVPFPTSASSMQSSPSSPTVTILPCAPQKPLQNDDTAKADDLKRHTCDIARDSHRLEDEIRAMVSSYMAPRDDEDPELAIGRLVC